MIENFVRYTTMAGLLAIATTASCQSAFGLEGHTGVGSPLGRLGSGLSDLLFGADPEYVQNEAFRQPPAVRSSSAADDRPQRIVVQTRARGPVAGVPAAQMRTQPGPLTARPVLQARHVAPEPRPAAQPTVPAPTRSTIPPYRPAPQRALAAEPHAQPLNPPPTVARQRAVPRKTAQAVQPANFETPPGSEPQGWAQFSENQVPTLAAPPVISDAALGPEFPSFAAEELSLPTPAGATGQPVADPGIYGQAAPGRAVVHPPIGPEPVQGPGMFPPGNNYAYTLASVLHDPQQEMEDQMREQAFCAQMWACAGGRCLSWRDRLLRDWRRNYEVIWRGPCGGGCCGSRPLLSAVGGPVLYPRNTHVARAMGMGYPTAAGDPCHRGECYWQGYCHECTSGY